MTIKELMTERLRMEQKISDAIKEFEDATSLKVENVSVVRCVPSAANSALKGITNITVMQK